jgi:tripartite-type tricarboxylate transporter receptor subunit TctC
MKRVLLVLVLVFAGNALAQQFPTRPLRIVVSFPAGGSVDFQARAIAERMSAGLGQPVLVENRPGGNSIIAAEFVARAPADGHTLFLPLDTTFTQAPALFTRLPYDPVRDFAPVSQTSIGNSVIVTHAKAGYRNLAELIAFAKANPGKLNFAVTGVNNQLASHLLRGITGVGIVDVPYKGSAPMLQALLAGEVDLVADGAAPYLTAIKQGRLVPLATTGRSRYFPDVPTAAEQGYPQLNFSPWTGLFAPAGTPPPVIARLNTEVVRALANPEVRERLVNYGLSPQSSTPEQLGAMLREDLARWGPIIKAAGLKLE